MRSLANLIAFQIGWFAAVLGPAHGMPWLGLAVVPFVLLLAMFLAPDWRPELVLALAAAVMGFVVDTGLIASGAFAPIPYLLPRPFSPPWMVMLWVNQATALNSCMAWMRERYVAGAIFGGIGGPLAYLGGAKLGAASLPGRRDLVILGVVWAIAFPSLLALNEAVQARFSTRGTSTGGRPAA